MWSVFFFSVYQFLLDTYIKFFMIVTLTYLLINSLFPKEKYHSYIPSTTNEPNTQFNNDRTSSTPVSTNTGVSSTIAFSEPLDTLYELQESVNPSTLDTDLEATNTKLDFSSRTPLNIAPSPKPSSSTPPTYPRHCPSRSSPSTALDYSLVTADTPPLTLSPSLSTTSTTSSIQDPPLSVPSLSSFNSKRRSSRVGLLIQQFEIGRLEDSSLSSSFLTPTISRSTTTTTNRTRRGTIGACTTSTGENVKEWININAEQSKYNNKDGDDANNANKINKRSKPRDINTDLPKSKISSYSSNNRSTPSSIYSPVVCHSPSGSTTPTSTRSVDYRSIGFRPAFTSWEKRIAEGNSVLVPLPSVSTPVWSSTRRHLQ
ncbi:uncharacterized protein BX664DRAFT_357770 [Halteromyces radiatus]|uniref:uncharacterized protein n=1 Tax=Halteromyces radiatus TaxID=101107 RepID=UPI00221F82BC|nr:uncharacterized protein BX664DRAFT_357770 [Halteromyces radiatus]KAI8093314.1 hypothetical protein BX664DRAFT_357770 [Halteromyces radiatus]